MSLRRIEDIARSPKPDEAISFYINVRLLRAKALIMTVNSHCQWSILFVIARPFLVLSLRGAEGDEAISFTSM